MNDPQAQPDDKKSSYLLNRVKTECIHKLFVLILNDKTYIYIYIYIYADYDSPRSKITMILKIAYFMLLFSMKKNIDKNTDKSFFTIKTLEKNIISTLYQNLWIELGILSKKIQSCSQLKVHMCHLKNVSPNLIVP